MQIWLCGGRLVHTPCSHIGHVARYQPYNFPGGRVQIEQYNYKRAIEVWMDDEHKQIIYNSFPDMMVRMCLSRVLVVFCCYACMM
ncbi:hypothetical protein DPMN_191311 [Dreissena polymorpha]|uniref:Uncharacterized protein n=1 Tax=Dreissena polymorpha TaxID=45954 RepID=A0A9D4BE97_DREPO|nr:hypothetical protein DPMN_191311 [Dreissena polymorpha]